MIYKSLTRILPLAICCQGILFAKVSYDEAKKNLEGAKYFFSEIGVHRSGSSLIGRMLREDPSALIGSEDRTVLKLMNGGLDWELDAVKEHILAGIEKKYPKHRDTFFSKKCTIIGDKSARHTTLAIMENQPKAEALVRWFNSQGLEVRWVFVVRNPIDVLASRLLFSIPSAKEHFKEKRELDPCEKVIAVTLASDYIHCMRGAYNKYIQLAKQNDSRELCIAIHYEDLINQPLDTLKQLAEFVGIEDSTGFALRNKSQIQIRSKKRDRFIFPKDIVRTFTHFAQSNPLFERYVSSILEVETADY